MAKSFLIDTTLCMGCRGCQVACKQWHDLPAEETVNRGGYQNPPDLSFVTYKLVRMREAVIEEKLNWLFFPDQCRHCVEPPCVEAAGDPTAAFKDKATGAVIYTANTRYLSAEDIINSCPYNIPRKGPNGLVAKCDMCLDRVQNGLQPACVQTCPTGAMRFGDREEILEDAKKRLAGVKKRFPEASLLDPDEVNVIFLTAFDPLSYHQFAIAKAPAPFSGTRRAALSKMTAPVSNAAARIT